MLLKIQSLHLSSIPVRKASVKLPSQAPRPSDEGWEGADWPSCAAGGGERRPRSGTDAGAASPTAGCSCARRWLQGIDDQFAGRQPVQRWKFSRMLVGRGQCRRAGCGRSASTVGFNRRTEPSAAASYPRRPKTSSLLHLLIMLCRGRQADKAGCSVLGALGSCWSASADARVGVGSSCTRARSLKRTLHACGCTAWVPHHPPILCLDNVCSATV